MRLSIKTLTLAIAAPLLLYGCKDKQGAKEPIQENTPALQDEAVFTPTQYANASIRTGQLTTRQIGGTIKANGVLDVPPQQLVSISVPMGGFVKHTPLLQGSFVTKGQVIASLENQEYIQLQQDYLETRSQYEYARSEYERQQSLAKDNINAGKVLQSAKANYNTLQARMSGLAQKLKLIHIDPASLNSSNIRSTINIYAPISGYVTDVNINLGQMVTPSDVMFKVVDTRHLHAELTVYEKDVPQIKIGDKVRFTLANETNERTASIYLVSRDIDASRTVRVHCHLDDEDKQLLPGMYLKAIIETNGKQADALPAPAIVSYEGHSYIFIEQAGTAKGDKRFKMLEVATGETDEGYTEVVLPDNFDRQSAIVVNGAYTILSKMKNSGEEE